MTVPYNIDAGEWFGPLPGNVTIGERSHLYSSYAFLHSESERECAVHVGRGSGIYGDTFFDLGPEAEVIIGEYCSLASPIISTNGRVQLGDFCWVAWETVLADTPYAVPPASRASVRDREGHESGEIVLEDNVWICARAVVLGGARIGEGSVVGAGAVVDFEVAPYSLVIGNPARVVRSIASATR